MEYYSAIKRNAFESILMRWMNLEPIIQSEVNQKEKNFTKKGLNDPDNHDSVITHLEPDILECEVKHHYEQS